MTVRYHRRHGTVWPTYVCQRQGVARAEPICQSIPGRDLDHAIGRLLLETVTPLTLEITLTVQQDSSLASMRAGRLFAEEDEHGIFFEAALPSGRDGARLMEMVRAGEICGASTGSTSSVGVVVNGVRAWNEIAAWEISLVSAPNRPARVGTWVRALGVAMRERQRLGGGEAA